MRLNGTDVLWEIVVFYSISGAKGGELRAWRLIIPTILAFTHRQGATAPSKGCGSDWRYSPGLRRAAAPGRETLACGIGDM